MDGMKNLTLLLFFALVGFGQTLQMNAGGPGVAPFVSDQGFTGGAAWVQMDLPVGFPTLRYGPAFSYDIPMHNGLYSVVLTFAEPNATGPGQRIFVATIQGQQASPVDVFSAVGSKAVYRIAYLAWVTTNHLRIQLQGIKGNAILSGIEVSVPAFAQ